MLASKVSERLETNGRTNKKAAGVVRTHPAAAYQTESTEIMDEKLQLCNINGSALMLQAMQQRGLNPLKSLDMKPDGQIHRYRVEGDKAGSLNGWYVLHLEPMPCGAYGSWKTGEQHQWKGAAKPMRKAEQAAMRRQMQAMQKAREAEARKVRQDAMAKAQKLWDRARPATNDHPYLQRKRVQAMGIRCLRDMLLIPLRDTAGRLHSLQFIGPDGVKRFLTGGRTAGCYCPLGSMKNRLLVCEGYATGATLWQATGEAVAVAFNAGNLKAVALALRHKFPQLPIVVCGDNDCGTEGNPGLTKAREAAHAVGGVCVVPTFGEARHV